MRSKDGTYFVTADELRAFRDSGKKYWYMREDGTTDLYEDELILRGADRWPMYLMDNSDSWFEQWGGDFERAVDEQLNPILRENFSTAEPSVERPRVISNSSPNATMRVVEATRSSLKEREILRLTEALVETAKLIDQVAENVRERAEYDVERLIRAIAGEVSELALILQQRIHLYVRDALSNETTDTFFLFAMLINPLDLQQLNLEKSRLAGFLGTELDGESLHYVQRFGSFIMDWRSTVVAPALSLLAEGSTSSRRYVVSADIPFIVRDAMIRNSVENIGELERRVEERARAVDRSTSQIGADDIAFAFAEAKRSSDVHSRSWTTGVFICVLIGVGLPIYALTADAAILSEIGGTSGFWVKLLVGVPFLALSAFCGHVAAHHREVSRYLGILIAQLKSVDAYSAALSPDEQAELWFGLGKRAFGDPRFALEPAKTPMVSDELKVLLDKLTEIISQLSKR
ncbi:hypothetical protein [Mycolicibacterium sp. S3B2]|uniref:hypothetical protein n=1 Tax=Mycolicibacterium sp. S3B2 TaxID=3415120 RepID=UPI003C7DD031